MKSSILAILIVCSFTTASYSQSITKLFLMLPTECTPQLNINERQILLQKGEYLLPGGDSIETVKYSIDTTESKDYLRYDITFTTGQRGFISFELRRFKKSDGKEILIFSRFGGARASFDQHDLLVFNIEKNTLKSITENLLPKQIDISEFVKKETPDSIKTKLKMSFNACYDLSFNQSGNITYKIFPQTQEANNWILYYAFEFVWNGSGFDINKMKE